MCLALFSKWGLINLKIKWVRQKAFRTVSALRKYSILLYQNSQNSHIMCSFLCLLICCGFPPYQPTAKNYTVSPSINDCGVPSSPPLAGSYCQSLLLTARLLCIPFSNTLSSSCPCCQDNTPSPPPPSSCIFSQSHKALKEISKITSRKRSLWCQNCQLLLSPEDVNPGHTAKRKTTTQMGKGRRIIMYPNQKFK